MIKLNPKKISKTFKIAFKTEEDRAFANDDRIKSYVFSLGDDKNEKVCYLRFNADRLDEINLTTIAKNEYRSTVNFSNITEVIYIPKYRAVRFESHTGDFYSILKVYWRGQFDLFINWPEKTYKNTIWSEDKDIYPLCLVSLPKNLILSPLK